MSIHPTMGILKRTGSLQQALEYHLAHRCFPPCGFLYPAARDAIAAGAANDPDRAIKLPTGISYRGARTAPAWAILDEYHLWVLVPYYGESEL